MQVLVLCEGQELASFAAVEESQSRYDRTLKFSLLLENIPFAKHLAFIDIVDKAVGIAAAKLKLHFNDKDLTTSC
jgi:hypothetical protein